MKLENILMAVLFIPSAFCVLFCGWMVILSVWVEWKERLRG